MARDGAIDFGDGLLLAGMYFLFQWLIYRAGGGTSSRKRKGEGGGLAIVLLLASAALLIQLSIGVMNTALEHLGDLFPGTRLGLFLGLLTVIPESFLLLRLAIQRGSLGFSGLLGDCLVSIPLVVGLSALVAPIQTKPFTGFASPAFDPYLHLAIGMAAFTYISFSKKDVGRKTGLLFMILYAIVWWRAKG